MKYLSFVEKILLAAVLIGAILALVKIDSLVLRVALLALAPVFFLSAFRPNEPAGRENEQIGFSDLLALTIVPKVLWISSAIAALGVASYLFDSRSGEYKQLCMLGSLTIVFATVLFLIFAASGAKNTKTVAPILLRAIPLCLVSLYILFK